MLLGGTPFLLEQEKHELVDKFNDKNGSYLILKLEPLEEEDDE